ncbi:GTPase Era [Notoacmeibacter ruber]|uniref:GTPase Era n=1 Tax=Notoacmeibacter ruber TaxID=2670375 RepID=A0A3L7JDD3_9HYPH|nr:GTPase Era [Notoacmeibacter ruber]RLQ87591.1 GTPase Era [Notoacmeibacter ruber]
MTDEPTRTDGIAQEGDTKSAFVTLLGATNAGKSTLLNRLVGSKVSIVTHKVQTTRTMVKGIAVQKQAQLVFIDTPGIFKPRRRLDRAMVASAWSGARDADIILFVVDAERGLEGDAAIILERLAENPRPKALLLNKIDRVKPDRLLELAAKANETVDFERTFMISALNGSGTADVMDWLEETAQPGPWYYPEDQIADAPLQLLAAEITREKLYLRLHQELPYSSHVETERWERSKKGIRVEQVIYVERDSQKKIVLGHKGQTIKAIGTAAREELSALLEEPIHLFLFVKVRDNWSDDPDRYREIGLDYSK